MHEESYPLLLPSNYLFFITYMCISFRYGNSFHNVPISNANSPPLFHFHPFPLFFDLTGTNDVTEQRNKIIEETAIT